MNKYLKYGIMGIVAVAMSAILFTPSTQETLQDSPRNYDDIIRSGVIRAVTEYNSISFYVDEDTISGLHYELLQAFAKEKGLTTEIVPEMDMNKRMQGLQDGTYDILANNVLISTDWKDSLLFTHPILLSRQVLVQREPEG